MRRDDDCITGLQGNQALENSGGSGIGSRNNCGNHTDGLCDLLDAEGLVLFNNTTGLGVFVCVVDVLSGIVVLDDLVFHNSHAGFFYSKLCKGDSCLVGSRSSCEENAIYLLLGKGRKFVLCCPGLFHGGNELIYTIHNIILFRFHWYPPVNDFLS